jgi:hypothetical protein
LFLFCGIEFGGWSSGQPDDLADAPMNWLENACLCVDGATVGGGLVAAELVGEDQIELRRPGLLRALLRGWKSSRR